MVMVFMLSETGTQLVSLRNVHDRCQNYQHEFANSQGSQATTIVKKEMQENADPRSQFLIPAIGAQDSRKIQKHQSCLSLKIPSSPAGHRGKSIAACSHAALPYANW
jgi:hypothetical protein